MANFTTNVDTVIASQASKETTINAAFDAASQAMTYGRRASTSSGLTWGYYGGNVVKTDGTMAQIANGTLTLTASNTNYIVAAKATGAVSVSTANTNWLNQADYWRLYDVVAGAATVTSYTDSRDFMQRPATGGGGMATPALGGTGQDFSTVAKGGMISGTGSGTFGLTAVGTDGQVLSADSSSAGGVKWVAIPGGGDMLLGTSQTVTAAKTFGDDLLILAGSTSGTTKLNAANEAGTTTATFPAASGTVALTVDKLSAFAATSSAELAGVISDETGTGLLVFNNSPTFVDDITVGGAGVATGSVKIAGTTSGLVTLSVADAAGTYTLKLPTSDGDANQLLQTDGSGNTTWATVSAGGGDMLLGTAQTVTADKTFNDGKLKLAGANSGITTIKSKDTFTGTVTLPESFGDAAAKNTGTGAGDVAAGNHNHSGTYEPADATILKSAAIGVSVQAYDADLTTWAGITPGANVGTFLATPSSANLAAAVTNETGSGSLVFATSPTLTTPKINDTSSNHTYDIAVSELTENRTITLPLLTSADTFTFNDFAATLKSKTLEAAVFNNGYTEESYSATASNYSTISLANGTLQTITLNQASTTITFPANDAGKSFLLILKQDGTGSRTVTWDTDVKWPGGTAPTITATASKADLFSFICDGAAWFGVNAGQVYL